MNESKLKTARTNWERYREARERNHRDYIVKSDLCNNFFFSDQWTEEEKKRLDRVNRPYLTINKIKPTILDMTGEYISNRADVKYVPSTGGEPTTAQTLSKLYRNIGHVEDLTAKELDLWFDGMITSRAYYDVRIGFDDNFQGHVRVTVPNPKNIIPDPESDSRNPEDWNEVFLLSYMTEQDIETYYGKKKAEELKKAAAAAVDYANADEEETKKDTFGRQAFYGDVSSEGVSDRRTRRQYFVVERQFRTMQQVPHFVNDRTGDVRRVPPSWSDVDVAEVLETNEDLKVERLRKQIVRWVVTCGSVVLHDDVSPYDAFTIIPWFPVFRRGRASGAVEDLIDPQRNFNKLRSQELHIVNGTANSGWKVRDGALTNMTPEDLEAEGSKTGLVLVFNEKAEDIERIQPNNIPQGMDRISSKSEQDLRTISGIDDESRGVARSDTPGKAIEARRQASLVSLATYFESLNYTRRLLAQRILKLVQKFYTEERQLRITRPGIRGEVEDVSINQKDEETGEIRNDLTIGEYDVVIVPAPQRESEEQEQFEELRQMQVDLGISVPAHRFIEASHLRDKAEIAEEIKQLNGLGEPSEEQKRIEQMERELEMEEKQASILARQAQAQLSQARAKKVLSEIQMEDLSDTKMDELMLRARELDNERWRDEQSMEIRKQAQETDEIKLMLEDDVKREQIRAMLEQRKDDNDREKRGSSIRETTTEDS